LMGIKGSFIFISFPWQSKSVRHKRYSDYNSAAIMLDRTRGKKKKKTTFSQYTTLTTTLVLQNGACFLGKPFARTPWRQRDW